VDTSRRLLGVPVWGHQGTSRIRQAPVADPALIRSLDVGQVAYIYRGGVTFVQVKRLIGGPAALPGPTVLAGTDGLADPAEMAGPDGLADPAEMAAPPTSAPRRPLPDVSELLDEAFGPEAGP
jgi:hypothetical protein